MGNPVDNPYVSYLSSISVKIRNIVRDMGSALMKAPDDTPMYYQYIQIHEQST